MKIILNVTSMPFLLGKGRGGYKRGGGGMPKGAAVTRGLRPRGHDKGAPMRGGGGNLLHHADKNS